MLPVSSSSSAAHCSLSTTMSTEEYPNTSTTEEYLAPIPPRPDNRTGRRTRRRVGPSDPGPPTRRGEPADLMALMANYNPHPPRRDAFPILPVIRVLPVVMVSAAPKSPLRRTTTNTSPIHKYLDSLKDMLLWDVNPNRSNYLRYYDGEKEAGGPTGKKLLQCYSCDKCGQLDHRSMFACSRAGHVFCRFCSGDLRSTDNSNHHLGRCFLCQSNACEGFRTLAPMPWDLMENIPLQCQWNELGCNEKIYEPNYEAHAASCSEGWRCFLCSKKIRPDEIEAHFSARDGTEHHPRTYLRPRTSIDGGAEEGNLKVEFDLRIPYMSKFAVCRFTVKGLGAFVLYQLQLDEHETMWIVVFQNGTNPDNANKVKVDIELTATASSNFDEEGVHRLKWVNVIQPWKTRLIHSLDDIMKDDESLTKTAKFNFKPLAEKYGLKSVRCNLSLQVKRIESGSSPSEFGLVESLPPVETIFPIRELENLKLG